MVAVEFSRISMLLEPETSTLPATFKIASPATVL